MCLGIPGKVIEFVDPTCQIARVEISGVRRSVHVGLVLPDGLEVGDWVLIHVGFALAKIDEAEADRTLRFLHELDEVYEQEMEQLAAQGMGDRE
jgi:hydrogenase expression/formation protein HypC